MTDRAHLAFTLALHRVVAPPGSGVCWSPFSVASALGLLAQGAAGETRDELATALLGDAHGDLGELGKLLLQATELDAPRGDEDEPMIAVANTLWTDESVDVLVSFVEELGRWSNGTVREAPFQTAPGQARDLVNVDVAKTTRDLVPELIPPGAITAETVSALVNALYLKCAWRLRFTEGATTPRPFHAPSATREVPTMALSERIGYAAQDGWQVATLRAVGGVEAVVLLPDGDLAEAEDALDADALGRLLDAPRLTQVDLALPRLEVRTKTELTEPLGRLGVRTAFTRDADLSGISPSPLAVEAVLHESVLRIDEQGLEGAAATAVMMRMVSMPTRSERMVVDRPFLLVVRHAATGAVYFMARVIEP
ncbi:serpin family protein [Actinophytocola gossypii]|uniref:Serpin family protein n=1 Tax=Actinophytocola gossypii TaxID=2812003 RepID=A0ABT2JAJ7_9PSEU|nr:serpin family protein [Actinophytocola gossypii]MCT2584895.1 serpin family protein [Actinophytocola gossypii]